VFKQLENGMRRLHGLGLALAIASWLLLVSMALFCMVGGFVFPSPTVSKPPATATVQATQVAIILPTPTPGTGAPQPTPVLTAPADYPQLPWEFGYGIAAQSVVPVNGNYTYTLAQVKDNLGMPWVKQQLRWDDIEKTPGQYDWSLYEPVMDVSGRLGLKVMLSIVGAPAWSRSYTDDTPEKAPADDPSAYANFVGVVVDHYKGRIGAIEVWNEQNLNREWDTAEGINAAKYVEMLRLTYQAIKSRDPNIIVISGALSPTGGDQGDPANPARLIVQNDFTYLQKMIDAGALQYADCVGAHHNGINMPPTVAYDEGYNDPTATFRGPFDNKHISWSFKSTLLGYHEVIQKAGAQTPLCVTEFGWASADGWSQVPVGFEFARDNTEAEQAQWVVEAYQMMRKWGFVRLAFLWNLDYGQKGGVGELDPNAPYSIVRFDGSPRPAFDAVKQMPKYP